MEKVKVVWDLNDEKIYRIAGAKLALNLLEKNGILPAIVKKKDFEELVELLAIKLSLATRGKARYFGDFDVYYNSLRFKRNKTEEEQRIFEELRRLRKEIKKNSEIKKLLQLATLDVLLTDFNIGDSLAELSRSDNIIVKVKHDRVDEKILHIIRKYKKTVVPALRNCMIDSNEIEKVWIEFKTVRFPVRKEIEYIDKLVVEERPEVHIVHQYRKKEDEEHWFGLVTGAVLGRTKKISISLKKQLRLYKKKKKKNKKDKKIEKTKLFLPVVVIGNKICNVENELPVNLHVLKPKFVSVRAERNGKVYVKEEKPVEYKEIKLGKFTMKVPEKVLVRWKLVKPKPTARIMLARKKFRSYVGAVHIYYVIRTKDGKVYRYRKYTIVFFWCGHALVEVRSKNVKTKEFARLYGILVDNDTGEKWLLKLGYDEQSEIKKEVRRYYLNLMQHSNGALIFGNQAIILAEGKMRKAIRKYMMRNAKEVNRLYTLEGWKGNLNHDVVSIYPFRVFVKDVEYNGIPHRVYVIIPSRNGQEFDILNHHHHGQGFDRVTIKANMNDLVVIVHQHPDMSNHEVFRYKEFWRTIEKKVTGPNSVLYIVEPYCYQYS